MNIGDIERLWEIAKQHPVKAFIIAICTIISIGIIAWLKGFISEKGRQFAASKKEMKKINKNKAEELKSQFPNGYQIFSIIDRKIIPYRKFQTEEVKIDWSTAEIINVNKDYIEIMLPDAQLPGNNILKSNMIRVANREGLISSGHFVINGWSSVVKILRSDKEKIIAVVGYEKINRQNLS